MTVLDRKQAPPFQLSNNYSLALPETLQLPGGVNFSFYKNLQQEAVKLELTYSAGRWYEPVSGISHFTAQMLPKGTEERDSFMIAEALDSLGAHLEINAGFDVVEISLYALKKNLLASLRVVKEILESPTFDEEELRIVKEIFLQNLRVNNEKNNVVASKEIRKAVFGAAHPYGGSVEEEDVNNINPKDLHSYFAENFNLHSVFLIGHFTDRDIEEVTRLIPVSPKKRHRLAPFEVLPGKSHTLKKPGSVQTSIRLGELCIRKRENPEYFEAVMFNHVLGGFFGSRLMKNIREDKGLTYGIYSAMHHFLNGSFWVIGAEVNQENADIVVEEIKKEIKRLQEVPLSENELNIARNYFIGSWQSENATLFAVAEKVKSIELWNLSPDYYTKMLNHIREMKPDQILAAANKFNVSELFEIRVG